eukprot:6492728-Amphidinium_carterae.2
MQAVPDALKPQVADAMRVLQQRCALAAGGESVRALRCFSVGSTGAGAESSATMAGGAMAAQTKGQKWIFAVAHDPPLHAAVHCLARLDCWREAAWHFTEDSAPMNRYAKQVSHLLSDAPATHGKKPKHR